MVEQVRQSVGRCRERVLVLGFEAEKDTQLLLDRWRVVGLLGELGEQRPQFSSGNLLVLPSRL